VVKAIWGGGRGILKEHRRFNPNQRAEVGVSVREY